jgi:hypothetical protein
MALVNVAVGQVYQAHKGRRIQVEAVDASDTPPRVTAVELVAKHLRPCARPIMHAAAMCGCVPDVVETHGDSFTIVCTYRNESWCLPAWYEVQS